MYELIDGGISVLAGAYVFLAATGKIDMSSDKEKSKRWVEKYGKPMKLIGPFLIFFRLFRLSRVFMG